jgi:hypothetical protein
VIGLDNKIDIDEAGKRVPRPPRKDAVVIVDIARRDTPRIVGTLPLMNSLLGPPTNLAITPDDRVALVANSVEWVEEGGTWKPAPDNKLFVIDLQASPPQLVETVTVGKQPSGMAISKAGTLVLIANRADRITAESSGWNPCWRIVWSSSHFIATPKHAGGRGDHDRSRRFVKP